MTAHVDKSPADIAQDLRDLSEIMLDRATDIDFYGGMNQDWVIMARWLISASAVTQFFASQVQTPKAQA